MNILNSTKIDLGAESREDAQISTEALGLKLGQLQSQLLSLADDNHHQRAQLRLELADLQIALNQGDAAWASAFAAFQYYAEAEKWASAVTACDALFRSDQPRSLAALAHSVWISVTFPLDPALTISQLRHIIDETPDDSDGAAIAAATAAYIANLRGNGGDNSDIVLEVGQMLNQVAREHGDVHDQTQFDAWFRSLELDQPEKVLPRLRNIIDVLAQDDWWIDRDALQARLPA